MTLNTPIYENCILCNTECQEKINTFPIDINNRLYYIEGAGQLCNFCYKDLYN